MKKNITINMQGRLYAIDEDAYNLLKQYEDSLRSYFAGKEGGHEIVDDIEARIAELFDEVVASGKAAIDIADVQRIISRMGNPQQMDGGDNTGDGDGAYARCEGDGSIPIWDRIKRAVYRPGRRLFRDTANKRIAGVMAGLAHYYGGDVTWWRIGAGIAVPLLMVCLQLGHCLLYWLVAYFVLALVLPPACSAEDRLRMNGRDVTPQNLAEEVTAGNTAPACERPVERQGCLGAVGEMILFGIKLVMWLVAGMFVLGCVFLLAMLLLLLFVPSFALFRETGMAFSWASHPWVGTIGVASLVLFIVLVVYSLAIGRKTGGGEPRSLSTAGRVGIALLVIASLTGIISCGTIILSELSKQADLTAVREANEWRDSNMHNGMFISETDWTYMCDNGWTLKQADHCNDRYTDSGQYYTGNDERRYLDCYDEGGQQLYRMERTDSALQKGTYTLTATVRADGPGAYIYALADGKTYLAEIPAEGNTGGTLWQEAKMATQNLSADSVLTSSTKRLLMIAQANNENGFGWCKVTVGGIRVARGKVNYGVTTVPDITRNHFDGTWFSATDFRLEKQ